MIHKMIYTSSIRINLVTNFAILGLLLFFIFFYRKFLIKLQIINYKSTCVCKSISIS
jgi:hypothetical protein